MECKQERVKEDIERHTLLLLFTITIVNTELTNDSLEHNTWNGRNKVNYKCRRDTCLHHTTDKMSNPSTLKWVD